MHAGLQNKVWLRKLHGKIYGAVLVLTATFVAMPAAAQDEGPGVTYKRKTVINFDDDTIEGDLKTPDGQYLEVKKKMQHRKLIRIREDFRREVLGSVSNL